MSAPEPRVHLTSEREQQMRAWRYTRPDGVVIRPIFLDELVDNTATLARLQSRWDARDTALRALIKKWRTESGNWQVDRCADELERAIGGGE